jgi:hypothetical protein
MKPVDEHALAYLLAFDGRIHHLEQAYWLKFEIKRVSSTPERPHGLSYAFTLHDPDGARLIGFDNAHGVPSKGARFKKRNTKNDHWHRTGDDHGRPYEFTTADQLLADFFSEVRRVLAERGLSDTVTGESETKGGRK